MMIGGARRASGGCRSGDSSSSTMAGSAACGPLVIIGCLLVSLLSVSAAISICPQGCDCFVQGQYHAMHCENAGFKVIEPRYGSDTHQVVHYGDNKLRELPDDALSVYPIVKYLNVSHNFIKKVDAGALRGCKWIEWLDLSHNELRLHHSLHPRFLDNGQVRWLSLAENEEIGNELQRMPISEDANNTTWLESAHLKNLSLAKCRLPRLPVWMVRGLTSLEHLDLSFNQLKVLSPMALASMCRLSSLSLQVNAWNCRKEESCNNLRALAYMRETRGETEILGHEIFCPELIKNTVGMPNCDVALVPEEEHIYDQCIQVPVAEHVVYTPPLSFWLIVGIVAGCIVAFVFLAIICNSIVTAICKKRRTKNSVAAHRHSYDEELALRLKHLNNSS